MLGDLGKASHITGDGVEAVIPELKLPYKRGTEAVFFLDFHIFSIQFTKKTGNYRLLPVSFNISITNVADLKGSYDLLYGVMDFFCTTIAGPF